MKVNYAERISRLLRIPVSHRLLVLAAAALLVAGFALTLSGVQEAHAGTTIKSTKSNTSDRLLAPGPCPVTNGPFTITEGGDPSAPCGDGINENTTWTFDFNPNSCDPSGPLTSAVLTLTLTPRDPGFTNDRVQIVGLPSIAVTIPPWAGGPPLALNVTSTISKDLIGDYTSSQILGIFTANSGSIPMAYQDDATISFAELDLTCEPPPVGGLVALSVSDSGSPVPWAPLAAVAASVMAVMGAGLWYGRRRWLR